MTDWPENDRTMRFSDLTEPVGDLVRQAYFLDPNLTAIREGLTWKGPSLPKSLAAICLSFEETLDGGGLRYNEEDQGRDPLAVIIAIAVQLGIEQGRRIACRDTEHDDLRARGLKVSEHLQEEERK